VRRSAINDDHPTTSARLGASSASGTITEIDGEEIVSYTLRDDILEQLVF
jgi:hypothetical protein